MLVLSRRAGESIRISDNIEVTVVEVRGNRVRLGVCAPRRIPISREEVRERSSVRHVLEQSDSGKTICEAAT